MGQKTNPNILRLGKNKEWKSKYLEKKTTELSAYTFRNLEIEKFILRLFETNGLKVQNCKINNSESALYLHISYFNLLSLAGLNEKDEKNRAIKTKFNPVKSKEFQNKHLNLKKRILRNHFYTKKLYNKTSINNKQIDKLYFLNQRTQKLESINNYQTYKDTESFQTLNKKSSNLFIKKVIKSLQLFTSKKQTIVLNLKQLNTERSLLSEFSKKKKQIITGKLIKLRKFQQNEFFKNGINILYNCISNNQTSDFLAKFIALYLKKIKRPSFFLRFLKTVLKLFINKRFSKFKRIQIKIKGRFNAAPRASNKFINIGKNIPVLTINSQINYSETTAYTSNGTFGVKVWTYSD